MRANVGLGYLFASSCIFCFALSSSSAIAGECGKERYFHPDETHALMPLRYPHPMFSHMWARAKKGDALEQRNLAVSYESGFLVSKCLPSAVKWYERASKNGDAVAQTWMERNGTLLRLAVATECYGSACSVGLDGLALSMTLISDPRGHFFADVTINGVTMRGLIDTGATTLALGAANASKMGLSTAGGAVLLRCLPPTGRLAAYRKSFHRYESDSLAWMMLKSR